MSEQEKGTSMVLGILPPKFASIFLLFFASRTDSTLMVTFGRIFDLTVQRIHCWFPLDFPRKKSTHMILLRQMILTRRRRLLTKIIATQEARKTVFSAEAFSRSSCTIGEHVS